MGDIFKLNCAGLRRALADAVPSVPCLTPTSTADDLANLLSFAQDTGILECPKGLKITSYPVAVDQASTVVIAVRVTEYPGAQVIVATEPISGLGGRVTRGRTARFGGTIRWPARSLRWRTPQCPH